MLFFLFSISTVCTKNVHTVEEDLYHPFSSQCFGSGSVWIRIMGTSWIRRMLIWIQEVEKADKFPVPKVKTELESAKEG